MYGTLTAPPASILGKCRANLIWLCFLLTFWPTFLYDASDTVACNGVQRHCNSILMLEDASQAGRTVCGPACASEGAGASQSATGRAACTRRPRNSRRSVVVCARSCAWSVPLDAWGALCHSTLGAPGRWGRRPYLAASPWLAWMSSVVVVIAGLVAISVYTRVIFLFGQPVCCWSRCQRVVESGGRVRPAIVWPGSRGRQRDSAADRRARSVP